MFNLVETLTAREKQIFSLLLTGASNPEIADSLSISVSAVKFHFTNIFPKLGVTNRAGAIAYGLRDWDNMGVGAPQITPLGSAYTEEQIRKAAMQAVERVKVDKKVVNELVYELLAALNGK